MGLWAKEDRILLMTFLPTKSSPQVLSGVFKDEFSNLILRAVPFSLSTWTFRPNEYPFGNECAYPNRPRDEGD